METRSAKELAEALNRYEWRSRTDWHEWLGGVLSKTPGTFRIERHEAEAVVQMHELAALRQQAAAQAAVVAAAEAFVFAEPEDGDDPFDPFDALRMACVALREARKEVGDAGN